MDVGMHVRWMNNKKKKKKSKTRFEKQVGIIIGSGNILRLYYIGDLSQWLSRKNIMSVDKINMTSFNSTRYE